jgi:hypothetical protein
MIHYPRRKEAMMRIRMEVRATLNILYASLILPQPLQFTAPAFEHILLPQLTTQADLMLSNLEMSRGRWNNGMQLVLQPSSQESIFSLNSKEANSRSHFH